jgi:hypothetical protein
MTRAEFDNTKFSKGMRVRINTTIFAEILAVNFENRTIGVRISTEHEQLQWFNCSVCEIIIGKRS